MLEKIALQKKMITRDDYIKAVALCKSAENYEEALKDYFISNNLITAKKVEQLFRTVTTVKIIKKSMKFGDVAIKLGLIDQKILQTALQEQKISAAKNRQPKLIGKILFESGELTKKQIMLIMQEQKKIRLKIKAGKNIPAKQVKTKPVPAQSRKPDEIKKPDTPLKKDFKTSEKIMGGMVLKIDKNSMTAYLLKTNDFDNSITTDDIYTVLATKMIQFGLVNEQIINGFIKSSGFKKKPFKVASGMDMIQGQDTRIDYYFDTDYLKAGDMDKEGNIDFKERGSIPKVKANILLAEKIPLKESRNGRDIFGYEIFARPVMDVVLKTEKGAYLSEDETKLYSSVSGYPKLSFSGAVNVLDVFSIKGDVGFETGHVIYDGNIEVKGCLKSGFRIKGHDVKIAQIDGGKITADGDVMILNGVNNATIYSRGHVSAKFVHNSSISCLGNLKVKKEIVDSNIETSGACLINQGEIMNSQIASNNGLQVLNIGTRRTNPNKITVGQDIFLANELKQIDEKINTIKLKTDKQESRKKRLIDDNDRHHQVTFQIINKLENCRNKKQTIKAQINKTADQSNENKVLKTFKDKLKHCTNLLKQLDKELNNEFDNIEKKQKKIHDIDLKFIIFEEQLSDLYFEKENFIEWGNANTGNPTVIADGKVYADTDIKGKYSQKRLYETISRVKIQEVLLEQNLYEVQVHDNFRR